ncbi:uncharacterized protein [Clytia hemisphaerica]|uniref:uncharacterized protein n=1 Tax=Clytia hemisphaerica TaxID=252671 RepID=UPI0034D7481B
MWKGILFLGSFFSIKLCKCQIRRVGQAMGADKVTYGYAKMVAHEGFILNMNSTNTTKTNSYQDCITNCINVDNCFSINVNQTDNGDIECQLLETDRFRSSSKFVRMETSTHYAIEHDCEWKETCINPNKKCIPNYEDGTFDCVCPEGFDENCINKNIALHKNTVMSSELNYENVAWRATDGNFGEGCISTHSALNMPTAWLRIDLGDWYIIRMIIIHNRDHSNAGVRARLSNTDIFVYDQNPTDNRRFCGHITNGEKFVIEIPCSEVAKGVELYLEETSEPRILNVCEVIVY